MILQAALQNLEQMVAERNLQKAEERITRASKGETATPGDNESYIGLVVVMEEADKR